MPTRLKFMKLTRHNGRSGKSGIYSAKHNDRQFDLSNAEHIKQEEVNHNVYWDCFNGIRQGENSDIESFETVESNYYNIKYSEAVEAQNQRNIKNGHPERNRTPEDLLHDKRTCPEESILQIGNIDETVDAEKLLLIVNAFFSIMAERYGECLHYLDWSLHVDEGTPHIHERHVFDCDDGYGFIKPQQEKALEKLGIPLPHPDKKQSKTNNRKLTFDKISRELLLEICDNNSLYLDKEPTYGGREHLEKQEYIIMAQREKIEKLDSEIEEKTLKLQDVEKLVDEVSESAYEKACEVVAEAVQSETTQADIDSIEKYKTRLISPESDLKPKEKNLIEKVLNTVQERFRKAKNKVLGVIIEHLINPEVKKTKTNEIKETTRKSILEILSRPLPKKDDTDSQKKTKNIGEQTR